MSDQSAQVLGDVILWECTHPGVFAGDRQLGFCRVMAVVPVQSPPALFQMTPATPATSTDLTVISREQTFVAVQSE